MKVKINKKTYTIKPLAVGSIAAAVVLCIALGVVLTRPKAPEPEPEPEPTADIDEKYDASEGVLDTTELESTVLMETEDAGQEYIDSTLFLGDSNTARFIRVLDPETKKTFSTKNNTIGVVGMGIDAISSLACMDFYTGRYTMPQAVKILQPERVIITFGTNNLYGNSTDATSFISRYEAQVKTIENAYPYADIIINSIPPVSKVRDYTNVSMIQIDAYNKAIAEMCKKNDWKYLNSAEALKDKDTGYARPGYMVADGLHLDQKGLVALFKYIRTHAYITEDDRPKPLASIPGIIGVPDGLIKINPLNEEEFTEDPSEPEPTAATEKPEKTAEATSTPAMDCVNGTYNEEKKVCVCDEKYTVDTQTGACTVEAESTASPSPDASGTPEATSTPTASSNPTPTPSPSQTATPTPAPDITCPDGGTYPAGTDCSLHPAPNVTCPDGGSYPAGTDCSLHPAPNVTCPDGGSYPAGTDCSLHPAPNVTCPDGGSYPAGTDCSLHPAPEPDPQPENPAPAQQDQPQ